MRILYRVITAALVLAGMALLWAPVHAATFAPTRFKVVDEGTTGKLDVISIPGPSSSRAGWSGEAKRLAPNYRLHLLQLDGFSGQPAGANAAGQMLAEKVEEVHAYIAATGMHPAVVVQSLGGLLTLMLAKQYPGDMRKMVIVDSLPFLGRSIPGSDGGDIKPMADGLKAQIVSAGGGDGGCAVPGAVQADA